MKQFCSLSPATVIDNNDPERIGRVQVLLGDADDDKPATRLWARVVTLTAGERRGSWFMPELQDEVLIAFDDSQNGEAYVIGAMWSDRNRPPELARRNGNPTKLLRTRSGLQLKMDDQDGVESLTLETPGGQKLKLKDGPDKIEIADNSGNTIELEASGITIRSSAQVIVQASMVKLNAGAIDVASALSKFSGTVQCDTLITNSVVASSYTPGAGNIW